MNEKNLPQAEHRVTRVEALAAYFRARPMVWIYALDLEFAGRQAWRSRLSNLRFAPYNMRITNRQTIVRRADGRGVFTKSEYRYEPVDMTRNSERQEGAVAGAEDASHSNL